MPQLSSVLLSCGAQSDPLGQAAHSAVSASAPARHDSFLVKACIALSYKTALLDVRAWCCRVWYRTRDGGEMAATVEAVDVMHPPPSFCVRLDGAASTRETEAPRLRAMPAADDPRAAAPPGARAPAWNPVKPALTLVHMMCGLAWLHLACVAPASGTLGSDNLQHASGQVPTSTNCD